MSLLSATVPELAAAVTVVSGALVALGVLVARIARLVRAAAQRLVWFADALEFVAGEMTHNGGSTARDAIAQLQRGHQALADGLRQLGATVADVPDPVRSPPPPEPPPRR